MIEEIHIRGLGVIEDATLALGPGLSVVTGETGAGKTLLVTAIQLLLGGRASADLVRRGHEAAVIEALVRVPARLLGGGPGGAPDDPGGPDGGGPDGLDATDAAELWALAEDGVLIVSREIAAVGRSRARVGGRLVPTSTLAGLLAPHIELHGQHEHVRLEQPAVQRRLLDAYGGPAHLALLDEHRGAYARWQDAVRRSRRLDEDAAARARRIEVLSAERDAIDAAVLDPVADARIDQDIDRLANADALRSALLAAHDAAGEGGALDGIGAAVGALRRSATTDEELLALAERLASLSRDLSDAVADLAALAADIETDDGRLDLLQQRKRDLAQLQRRFGATIPDVLDHRARIAEELAELELLEEDADGVRRAAALAETAARATAAALSSSRAQVGQRLSTAVGEHLEDLGLREAVVHVRLTAQEEPGPDGADRVDLLLAANPGEPAARLADAASGGERSRVALALEVVLSEAEGRSVLVFDEVDAGIGGSTALAVGEKLARLARPADGARQILCVTHLAQVAAYADEHHVVEKSVQGGRTVTRISNVVGSDREDVLSRMLGGEATAGAGLEHARALIAAARSRSPD